MPTVERDLRGQEYISVSAELPDKDFYPIAHAIWKALDDNGIILDDNAELSIRVYNGQDFDEWDSWDSGTFYIENDLPYPIIVV